MANLQLIPINGVTSKEPVASAITDNPAICFKSHKLWSVGAVTPLGS
ncbi:MAG: hypothetical protein AAGF28_02300 [Pseudomonadota bacterium]